MYNTLEELKKAEIYYNEVIIKENYESCFDEINKDNTPRIKNEKTFIQFWEEEDWWITDEYIT